MSHSSPRARVALTLRVVAAGAASLGLLSGCADAAPAPPVPSRALKTVAPRPPRTRPSTSPRPSATGTHSPTPTPSASGSSTPSPSPTPTPSGLPWHADIVATTFWVGEIFDPTAADGSQVISTYDGQWLAHYGGCDGVVVGKTCSTQVRTEANGWFPTAMKPLQNPFYLDLPYDDVNDAIGFAQRCAVVPWAGVGGGSGAGAGRCADPAYSYLKNHWVALQGPSGRTCFGQIEDAGPGQYHDAAYVFGPSSARPLNARYGGAGLDVSPALNGCLGFKELDGNTDRVGWRFVDAAQVAPGPWLKVVTTSGVTQ